MNNDVKIEKYYSPSKMRRAILLMEQLWLLSNNEAVSSEDQKCARAMFEHYRRLAMCILMKEMPDTLVNDLVIDVEYMKNMYKKYADQ